MPHLLPAVSSLFRPPPEATGAIKRRYQLHYPQEPEDRSKSPRSRYPTVGDRDFAPSRVTSPVVTAVSITQTGIAGVVHHGLQ